MLVILILIEIVLLGVALSEKSYHHVLRILALYWVVAAVAGWVAADGLMIMLQILIAWIVAPVAAFLVFSAVFYIVQKSWIDSLPND